jgi:Raf kinase inhibitor-like YbhB/YbcL family protein
MGNKALLSGLGILLIILGIIFTLRLLSSEDDWICVGENWIKHGKPAASMPNSPCGIGKEIIMKLKSPEFADNQKIPVKYTCNGEKINPQLLISEVPQETKSLVITMIDPDAVRGTFVHWIIYNIDPSTKEILENSIPDKSKVGLNSADQARYAPPCPPNGTHRYIFTLMALDTVLNIPDPINYASITSAVSGHVITQTNLIGLYR